MTMLKRALLGSLAMMTLVTTSTAQTRSEIVIQDCFATVHGVRFHYLIAGKGDPVVLLHGYAQTSRMWRPLMVELARTRTVIAPDLRGFGQSSKPTNGYDRRRWRRTFMLLRPHWDTIAQLLSVTTLD